MFGPDPKALATALGVVIGEGRVPPPAAPAFAPAATLAAWHEVLAPTAGRRPEKASERLVSIVIVHHEQPELLREAIESAMAQDHPAIEVVVVDDGSTTQAAVIALEEIESAAWTRPLRLVRQENRYLGAARNTGVREARGDVVAFLDDDDLLDAHYVTAMLGALERADADAVSCAIESVETPDDGAMTPGAPRGVWVFFGGDAVHLSTMWNLIGGAAAMFRAEALVDIGGFFELHGVGHEDWEVLVRLALGGHTVVSVPDPLYCYRVRGRSMLRTTSTWDNMQPVLATYEAVLPASLRSWPALIRGQHETIDLLRELLGQRRSGWRNDLALARSYLELGGLSLLARRVSTRAVRLAQSRRRR